MDGRWLYSSSPFYLYLVGRHVYFLATFASLLVFGQFLRGRRFSGKSVKSAKDFEESGKIAIEAIENVRTVQALTKEQLFYERFCRKLDGPHREAHKEALIQGLSYG